MTTRPALPPHLALRDPFLLRTLGRAAADDFARLNGPTASRKNDCAEQRHTPDPRPVAHRRSSDR